MVVGFGLVAGQRRSTNLLVILSFFCFSFVWLSFLPQVADPDVLFLDEPTSGLDSTSSEVILAALKDISRRGRTIIMVIHQPRYSIFTSMDNVIFLGPGGKTVYSGKWRLRYPSCSLCQVLCCVLIHLDIFLL